ncbi:MAG: T9SS type A sorting domain-containing protein [Flavobacteriales bacterium]|nr:T9SS type A sorting domain-containing protein [Flavobacteriales bacterium]
MGKRYALVLLIAVQGLAASAQTLLTPSEYDVLKLAHQLPADAVIISQPAPQGHYVPGIFREEGDTCSCWIEPDASYTLALAPNDDGSSPLINLPFSFNLYGDLYNTCHVNNNGNVSFVQSFGTYSSTGFPNNTNRMVAPFWADVDTRNDGGEVWYKVTPTAMYVNWVGVGYYNQQTDKRNWFQLIITDGMDPVIGVGRNVSFCYKDMQWTTGSASSGVNGFGGVPATVGANRANNTDDYTQIGRFDAPGDTYSGPQDTSGVDWLDHRHFVFTTTTNGTMPPVLGTSLLCDTLLLMETEGLQINVDAFPGLVGELVSLSAFSPTLAYSELENIEGEYAHMSLEMDPRVGDAGVHEVIFTATSSNSLQATLTVFLQVTADISTGIAGTTNPTLSIAPNPADDQLTVTWSTDRRPTRIEVVALDGQVVSSISPTATAERLQIDLSLLAPGAYVLRAAGMSGPMTTRFVRAAR